MAIPTKRLQASELAVYFLLTIVGVLILFPIYALILASFRPGRDLMRYGITFSSIIPNFFSPNNYSALLTGHHGDYPIWYRNSLILACSQTVLTLAFSSFVGYGLGVYQFKGKNALTILVLLIMIVPLQILILPLYKLMTTLHTMNTFQGMLLPFIVSPFAIFFFRQYAVGIPKDYLDAGRIDGLSEYAIFRRICVPLMVPAYGAMAILIAQQSWNNFLWPLIVVSTANMHTLTIGLNSLLTPYGNNYDMLIAGSCTASIPIIIVFFFFQRYFISGLTTGGIKG
jgi:arabinosaccharide transport system permease protein